MLVGIFLNWVAVFFEKGKILDVRNGFVEIDKDANPAAFGRLEDGMKQADDIELWKRSLLWVKHDFRREIFRQGRGGVAEHSNGKVGSETVIASGYFGKKSLAEIEVRALLLTAIHLV